jgi:molybdopterin converting factor small subunit
MQLRLSGTLLRFSDYRNEFQLDAPSVAAALEQLIGVAPRLRPALFDGDGRLRAVHRLFVDAEQIGDGELDRPLAADASVDIVTAVAGG